MLRKIMVVGAVMAGVIIGNFAFTPAVAEARSATYCTDSQSRLLGMPTWYKYLNYRWTGSECEVEFSFPQDVGKVLLAVFEMLLRVVVLLAVALVVWGSIKYIISQGEPERVAGARTTIINAVVGIVIALIATAVVNLIARTVTG